jgi:hypothetical protein
MIFRFFSLQRRVISALFKSFILGGQGGLDPGLSKMGVKGTNYGRKLKC